MSENRKSLVITTHTDANGKETVSVDAPGLNNLEIVGLCEIVRNLTVLAIMYPPEKSEEAKQLENESQP